MSSPALSRTSKRLKPSGTGAETPYEFLDSHAQVIEQLLPAVRAVAFFDARGNPLRGRGPVPLLETGAQVHAALKSAAAKTGHPVESILSITASDHAAALVLYANRGASARNRRRPVVGVCLVLLHVPDGVQPPSLDSLHLQLAPALDCVGYQLAQTAEIVASGYLPDSGASDLEWLFEVSAPVVQGEMSEAGQHRGERLSTIVAASVAHLQCVLGALLVPERQLRIVRTADAARHTAEEALRHLESPMLNWAQRKNQPMVVNKPTIVNKGDSAESPQSPLRILAVPVTGRASAPEGVLMLLRSTDAPEFSRAQLSLVKHLSRNISTLLETDFDVLTGLHTRSSAQGQVDGWQRATSLSTGTYSVICIDIDRLRAVNETSGFDAGDALIVRVARLLREPHLPPNAVAARVSGDEFAVALPYVDAEEAAQIARALQQAAAQLSRGRGWQRRACVLELRRGLLPGAE